MKSYQATNSQTDNDQPSLKYEVCNSADQVKEQSEAIVLAQEVAHMPAHKTELVQVGANQVYVEYHYYEEEVDESEADGDDDQVADIQVEVAI